MRTVMCCDVLTTFVTFADGCNTNPDICNVLRPAFEENEAIIRTILHEFALFQRLAPARFEFLDRSDAFPDRGEAAQGFAIAAKLPALIATHLRREAVRDASALDPALQFLERIGAPDTDIARRARFSPSRACMPRPWEAPRTREAGLAQKSENAPERLLDESMNESTCPARSTASAAGGGMEPVKSW